MKIRFTPTIMVLFILAVLEVCLYIGLTGDAFLFSQRIMHLIICVICIRLGLKEHFIANPFFCFVFTPFSLMIYDPSISSRWLTVLENRIYFLATMSFLAFILGLHFMLTCRITKKPKPLPAETGNYSHDYVRIGTLLLAGWYIYQIGRIVFHVNIPLSAIIVQAVYIGISFLLISKRPIPRAVAIITMVFILITGFRKTSFLYVFMLALLSVLMNAKKNSKSMFWGTLAILVGGFFLIVYAYPLKSYFREYGSFAGLSGVGELMEITERNNQGYGNLNIGFGLEYYLLRPYLSMTTEWVNLNYVLETQPSSTYGMWFLKPILNILQISTDKMSVYELIPRYNSYNTFGFLTIQVKDFGFFGAVLLTFLEGIFSGWVYKRYMRHKSSPLYTAQYMYVSTAILEMFFSNHFFMGGIHIAFLLSWIILFVLRRVNRKVYQQLKN